MKHHSARIALSFATLCAVGVSIPACSGQSSTSVRNGDFASLNGARVELVEEGGIAALASSRVVRHDDRFFSYVQRRICSTVCGAPIDSTAGTLTPAAADSLFTTVLAQSPLALSQDYGTTRGGADMVSYTLTVSTTSGSRTVHADDGTMPPPMRHIVDAIHGIVAAARK